MMRARLFHRAATRLAAGLAGLAGLARSPRLPLVISAGAVAAGVLFATGVAGGGTQSGPPPGRGAGALVTAEGGGAGLASADDPRPFRHSAHAALACTECHGAGDEHRTLRVRTAYDCASCHHDPGRGLDCSSCHDPAGLEAPREVEATLAFSVWEEARARTLAFRHELHAGIGCRSCHVTEVTLAPASCASCHDAHHREGATCATCHERPPRGVHGLEAHLTCGGSGCHQGVAAARPALSRELCLVCHTGRRNHQPQASCHTCHVVPDGEGLGDGAHDWLSGAWLDVPPSSGRAKANGY